MALLAGLLLAACAAVPVAPPEEIVRQRANERWRALVDRDFAKARSYHTSAYQAAVDTQTYRDRFGKTVWSGGEVVKVVCPDAVKCIGTVRMESKNLFWRKYGDNISTHDEETWVLEDGQWWLKQK